MSVTPDFASVTLKWAGVLLDGSPATGTISLEYSGGPMLDDNVTLPLSVFPTTMTKALTTVNMQVPSDKGGGTVAMTVGYAEWIVPATNDTSIPGSGGTYNVVENINRGRGRTFDIIADKDAPGGVIWLNKIAPTAPVAGEVLGAVYRADFNDLLNRIEELEVGGVGGGSGPVASTNITDASTVGKAVLTATNAAAARATLGAAATTDQTALAGRVTTLEGAEVTAAEIVDSTTTGQALLTATNAATARAALAAAAATDVDLAAVDAGTAKGSTQRTLITAFAAGHGWTTGGGPAASNLNDTTDAGLGSQCVSFTTATATAGYVESPTLSTPLNLTGKTFAVLVKLPAANLDSMSYAYLYAGSGGGFTNYNRWTIRLRTAQQNNQSAYTTGDEWVWLTLPRSGMAVGAGAVDLTAINKLRIIISPLTGVQSTIKVGAVALVDQPTATFPNGVVSITFDDGYSSIASLAKPAMDRAGMRGTVFPINEVLGQAGKLTVADLLTMQRNGWEVGLHTNLLQSHADGFLGASDATIRADMAASQAGYAAAGLGRPTGFAWPRGRLDGAAVRSVRRAARYGRLNDWASGGETLPPGDPFRLRSYPVAATDTLATLTGLVDAAKAGQSWLVLTVHEILATGATGGQQMNQAIFTGLIDYLAASGVPVMPIGEVLDNLTTESTALARTIAGKAPLVHGHAIADLPAGSVVSVAYTGSAWPARPTDRADIIVMFVGPASPAPPTVSSGTGGMREGDVRLVV